MKRAAKSKSASVEEVVRRAWVYKHKLPPTHPLWTGQPFAEHLLEFFRDQLNEKARLEEQLKNPELPPNLRIKLKEAIDSIDAILDDDDVGDGRWKTTNDPVSDWLEYKEEVLDEELEEEDLDITPDEARQKLREHGY